MRPAIACVLCMLGSSVAAEEVTYYFSGSLAPRSVWAVEHQEFLNAEAFSASVTIDTDALPTSQTEYVAVYDNAVTDFRMRVYGLEYEIDVANTHGNYVEIWNDHNYDASYVRDKIEIFVSMVGPEVPCTGNCAGPVKYMHLNFYGPMDDLSVLDSTQIPIEIDLNDYQNPARPSYSSNSWYWAYGGGQTFHASMYEFVGPFDGIVGDIDIVPGDTDLHPNKNVVYPNKGGKIPVAVLGGASFDTLQIDPLTIRFGAAEATPAESPVASDVDGLNGDDLTARFRTGDTGIMCNDYYAVLTAETYAGEVVRATDRVVANDCVEGGCHAY